MDVLFAHDGCSVVGDIHNTPHPISPFKPKDEFPNPPDGSKPVRLSLLPTHGPSVTRRSSSVATLPSVSRDPNCGVAFVVGKVRVVDVGWEACVDRAHWFTRFRVGSCTMVCGNDAVDAVRIAVDMIVALLEFEWLLVVFE